MYLHFCSIYCWSFVFSIPFHIVLALLFVTDFSSSPADIHPTHTHTQTHTQKTWYTIHKLAEQLEMYICSNIVSHITDEIEHLINSICFIIIQHLLDSTEITNTTHWIESNWFEPFTHHIGFQKSTEKNSIISDDSSAQLSDFFVLIKRWKTTDWISIERNALCGDAMCFWREILHFVHSLDLAWEVKLALSRAKVKCSIAYFCLKMWKPTQNLNGSAWTCLPNLTEKMVFICKNLLVASEWNDLLIENTKTVNRLKAFVR